MIDILWNGRGGQGAFTAAKILGAAWVLKSDRSFALAFPSFGPERRGAPVRAFNKLGDRPINNRSEIKESDFIIYLDDTLFSGVALSGLKAGGKIILNTTKLYADARIVAVDADKIASGILNRPIANTAMLGALSAVCPDITIAEIEKAIAAALPERQVACNIAVAKAAKGAVG